MSQETSLFRKIQTAVAALALVGASLVAVVAQPSSAAPLVSAGKCKGGFGWDKNPDCP
jgi:Spy/CpxP family protein refolding chaperone